MHQSKNPKSSLKMAVQTPTTVVDAGLCAKQDDKAKSFSVDEIVPFVLLEVGIDDKVIEAYKQRIRGSQPRASIAWINFFRGIASRVLPWKKTTEPVTAEKDATDFQFPDQLYGPTCPVPDLNLPPPASWSTEELVSFCKKENSQYLSKFVERCLGRVDMLKVAEDFKQRLNAATGFENSESVKLWNYVTLPYMMHEKLVAAGMIEVPEIVKFPPLNAMFPTPQSVGWMPEQKEGAYNTMIIKEGHGGKRRAPADADEAGPSSPKKSKIVVMEMEVTTSCSSI